MEKSVAIMQPYIFPYIGYFHLIEACSEFVFYDDVTFIKSGWINRNRIIDKNGDLFFTVPLSKSSSNKLINEISPAFDNRWKNKFYKQLVQNYKKAPFFDGAINVVMAPFDLEYRDIGSLAIESISTVYSYLGIIFEFKKSSLSFPETVGLDKADRVIEITKRLNCESYINAPGGRKLYTKDYFHRKGVNLYFVKSHLAEYKQYHDRFVPWLSIIDMIMFCGKSQIIDFMQAFSLE